MKTLFFVISLITIVGIVTLFSVNFNKEIKETIRTRGMESHSIKGIDVSHHQKVIDWKKVKESGITFAFIKATESNWFKDSLFNYNSTEAKKNGIYIGVYHYYKPKKDPYKQFQNYKNSVPKELINFPPVIDLEYLYNDELLNPKNKKDFVRDVKILSDLMTKHYGVKPIFYTTKGFYHNLIENEFDNEIWICYLEKNEVSFLKPNQWNFRQYSFSGRINGINKNVDLNFFKGSKEEFMKKVINP
jgi:lysozyme